MTVEVVVVVVVEVVVVVVVVVDVVPLIVVVVVAVVLVPSVVEVVVLVPSVVVVVTLILTSLVQPTITAARAVSNKPKKQALFIYFNLFQAAFYHKNIEKTKKIWDNKHMPFYDYKCRQCRRVFEIQKGMNDRREPVCPDCGSAARRIFRVPGTTRPESGACSTCSSGVCSSCGVSK